MVTKSNELSEPKTKRKTAVEPKPKERAQTKKAKLIELLSAGKPVSLDKLSSALGWQRHTTSAAMTRLKQQGQNIISAKPDGKTRVYHIAAATLPKLSLASAGNKDPDEGGDEPQAKEAGSEASRTPDAGQQTKGREEA